MKSAIVGIGASAGGLEAISELLGSLVTRPGAVIVVVQHLGRTQDSLLPEILARKTALPVVEAADGLRVQPDHVYVIPPNVTLTVSDRVLRLSPRAAGRVIHMPVDALFRSLAEECGEAAVGVVLSGADSDGAAGTRAIKGAGGITFAQDPQTARVPGMPQSAIETGCIDFVLPPSQIASELIRLAAHPYLKSVINAAHAGEVEKEISLASGESVEADESNALRAVFRRLRSSHGVDFTRYKSSTLRRRLARRMALQRIESIVDYSSLLEHDAVETAALYQDFLIRVTEFFRDPDSFRAMAEHVLPMLAAHRSPKEPFRIWVPGCATGEEVYSIAITLLEFLGDAPTAGIQIFGTDVSESAIEKCRAGLYLDSIAQNVSPERLQRFFVKQGSHYLIARFVRDLCIFARQDITRDPPFSRLDLISCRNLLIYLGGAAQNRVMQVFRYALRPHGFLMLGPSESVGQGGELFEPVDKFNRLYRPRASAGAGFMASESGVPMAEQSPLTAIESTERDFLENESAQRQADRLLLARYAPAAILVDDTLNILQFRGHTAPYLSPASGTPSLNLQRIGRPELVMAISTALKEARESGKAARREALHMEGLGAVDMEVIPLSQAGTAFSYLILLEDESSRVPGRGERRAASVALTESEKDRHLARLERENQELREFLQATMEQHEAAREELRSAHEEVLSANEEFQSTNEELETSKEELQSSNEELTITNDELRDRNRQLGILNAEIAQARLASERARAYADGIVETVRESLVVLDGERKILRVNKAFTLEFGVQPEQVQGRSLDDVSVELWNQLLDGQLSAVLSAEPAASDFELVVNLPEEGRRVLSLSARKIAGDAERVELILLAIEDITERRARTDMLRNDSRRKDEFLATLAHELRNPLGAITHAVHLLVRGTAEHSGRLHLMIERQTRRLVRLVDDMLDVARIGRDLIEVKRQPLDLTLLVNNAAEAAAGRLEERNHVLSVSTPSAPVYVNGDAVRLEQVVSNLLENAIKYTEPGGRIVILLTEEGSTAVLRVIDNGIGLAPEAFERVFSLFAQIDSSADGSSGGLGLGLTVVRRVLELHGGSIHAWSAGLGQGSEFTVRLPLLEHPAEVSTDSLPEVASDGSAAARRIVIVDGNADSAEAMAMLFALWGHEVRLASDASSAHAVIAEFVPDTAFIDVNLPGVDGYELARRLRVEPDLRLIALTGYGRPEDRKRAHEAGFSAHLVKPATPDELLQILA